MEFRPLMYIVGYSAGNHAIEHATPQHYQGAKVADYWMEINPHQPPEWAKDYGGTLDQAYKILKGLRK